MGKQRRIDRSDVIIPSGLDIIRGSMAIPEEAEAVVLCAHAGGSNRSSPRAQYVAEVLHEAGMATLLVDLLTDDEFRVDERTQRLRFDIARLGMRLSAVVEWLLEEPRGNQMRIGLYGACTGAAAALITAAEHPEEIAAVVSRGGRPDLAADALAYIRAAVLFLVGSDDAAAIELNQYAARLLSSEHRLEIVPGASQAFREPGVLETAARLARDWFVEHLAISSAAQRTP